MAFSVAGPGCTHLLNKAGAEGKSGADGLFNSWPLVQQGWACRDVRARLPLEVSIMGVGGCYRWPHILASGCSNGV